MLPIRESPQHRTASSVSGRLASSQSRPRSTSGERPMSGTAKSYQARVRARFFSSSVAAGVVRLEEAERRRGVRDRVQLGEHLDARVLQAALVLERRVVQPVVAEVVGQHVLRHDPVDAVHQEERRAEHLAGRLHPAHGRHGDVGLLADDPHRVVLVLERVVGEDRQVLAPPARRGRRTRRDGASPSSVQAASRIRVSDDMPLASTPLCSVTTGSAPAGSTVASHSASRPGSVLASRLERCIFRSAGGGACVTCPSQVWRVTSISHLSASIGGTCSSCQRAWRVSPADRRNPHDTPTMYGVSCGNLAEKLRRWRLPARCRPQACPERARPQAGPVAGRLRASAGDHCCHDAHSDQQHRPATTTT